MNCLSKFKTLCVLALTVLISACATQKAPFDYTAYKQYQPKSILVLPPVNNTPDVKATYSVLSTTTYPLAEAGYYVFPNAVVEQTFKDNGLIQANDIQAVSHKKLQEIFGADAALYMAIEKYGSQFTVLNSQVVVYLKAKLVDLKTGTSIWSGEASASNSEGNNNGQGGLAALLVSAIIKQVLSNALDVSHDIAAVANERLLTPRQNGLLYGARSPNYGKDGAK